MSYAHTKRRKNITKFKRLFPEAWRAVLGLTAVRLSDASLVEEAIKCTTPQLPPHLSIGQTAAILGIRKRDVANVVDDGILKPVAKLSRADGCFHRDVVVNIIDVNARMSKPAFSVIPKVSDLQNSSIAARLQNSPVT